MNTQKIKTKLIAILGDKTVAYIQAFRFLYLLKTNNALDPEIQILNSMLQDGDTVVDVGANGADWTYYLHRCVGGNGAVFAFEADPYYALSTKITIWLLQMKGIHFFSFGLSNINEDVPLLTYDSEGLRISGLGCVDKRINHANEGVTIVRLKKLDSMIKDYPILLETKLIKCDVEGYELFVFQGADNIIETSRPFVILETGNYEKQGYKAHDVYNYFSSKQYLCFSMTDNKTPTATDSSMEHASAISVNRILIPEEKVNLVQGAVQMIF